MLRQLFRHSPSVAFQHHIKHHAQLRTRVRTIMSEAARPKAASANIHVLVVKLSFQSSDHRNIFRETWAPLAQTVYDTEPACLSYEFCNSTENETEAIIYERYTSKGDLDGKHQDTLKAFDLDSKFPAGFDNTMFKADLFHYTETNTGHMDR